MACAGCRRRREKMKKFATNVSRTIFKNADTTVATQEQTTATASPTTASPKIINKTVTSRITPKTTIYRGKGK